MAQTALKWTDQKFDPRPFLKDGARKSASFHSTEFGSIFGTDCMKMLPMIEDGIVDTVFADPPFNIGKQYRESTDDSLPAERYVAWCKEWLTECIRILKPGGSLFLYNLPKWNILLGPFLQEQGLDFRHWIAIEMSACLPIAGRLHPSHYSLLYYSKGKPNTFSSYSYPDHDLSTLRQRSEGLRGPPGCDEPKRRDAQRCLD